VQNQMGDVEFVFLAIPGSVDVTRTGNGQRGTLNAYIVGKDPRNTRQTSPTIFVSCDYRYEI
ncbi:MAG: hypothetical protein AAF202_08870, partial [Pseudomonadota bacterium]